MKTSKKSLKTPSRRGSRSIKPKKPSARVVSKVYMLTKYVKAKNAQEAVALDLRAPVDEVTALRATKEAIDTYAIGFEVDYPQEDDEDDEE